MDRARPTRDNVENVANRSAGGRRYNPDTTRQHRQRTLQFFRKESFSVQPIAELLESDAQRTRANRIECIDDEFILAARRVERELSACAHVKTVGGSKADLRVGGTKALGSQLRVEVFTRKFPVAGR